MLRTRTCGELRAEHAGERAVICGWVETIRDHGGVIFLDLRDFYGVTQIVLRDENLARGLTRETVAQIDGTVEKRGDGTENSKISTGEIEVFATAVKTLGACERALPFEIENSAATREETRLKYRFLDLRNPAVREKIVLRAEVIKFLRTKMEELGFLEVQTPILSASSPEGARDFLVPSRRHKGKFYALPQAPQQFKQLLMASGFDKYFQIAPCFRDEDARQDRSPGEFYQLDFEMAFAEQDDVFAVAEEVVGELFTKFSRKAVSPRPFRHIPYKESMLKYGTDKPDLRNPLEIADLSDFFKNVNFAPFKNRPVRGIVADCSAKSRAFFEEAGKFAADIGMKGLGYLTLSDGGLKGPIDKFLTDEQRLELIKKVELKQDETLFFISDSAAAVNIFAGQIRTWLGENLSLIDENRHEFCFIVDFPMYEFNAETKKIDFTHNPFSMPQGGLDALLTQDPLEVLAWQYDIVCDGIELSSGAVRNHDPRIMRKAFELAGYGEDELKAQFGALYKAFSYGAPPHAGMAPGIERMVMILSGAKTIRDVTAFPLNGDGRDCLMNAPSEVTEAQLREVHIKVRD